MYNLLKARFSEDGDKETVHNAALSVGKSLGESKIKNLVNYLYNFQDERLETEVFGIDFPNPVGLAAGADKNGELVDIIPCLGFGFAEIGSITAYGHKGNPRPRVFVLPEDEAMINRMGSNNEGVDRIHEKLKDKKFEIPIGINITKTPDPEILGEEGVRDFYYSFQKSQGIGDFYVINVSCPNTEEGKTFEDKEVLEDLLYGINKIKKKNSNNRKPVLVKLSPDISYTLTKNLDNLLDTAEEYKIDGFVISNTSPKRDGLKTPYKKIDKLGKGGLSGKPIEERSNKLIAYVYDYSSRNMEIIGVGGVDSAQSAYDKILNGASLVELYTGLVLQFYKGPVSAVKGLGLIKNINQGLVDLLEREGYSSVEEAVGANV